MKYLIILITTLMLLLSSCCCRKWVITGNLNWIEPIYHITPDRICRIDTLRTAYGTDYRVFYK